jgi:hypothetical protein
MISREIIELLAEAIARDDYPRVHELMLPVKFYSCSRVSFNASDEQTFPIRGFLFSTHTPDPLTLFISEDIREPSLIRDLLTEFVRRSGFQKLPQYEIEEIEIKPRKEEKTEKVIRRKRK